MLQQFLFVRSGFSINWDNLIGWCSFKMMRDTSPSFWFYAASMQLFANFTNWEFVSFVPKVPYATPSVLVAGVEEQQIRLDRVAYDGQLSNV